MPCALAVSSEDGWILAASDVCFSAGGDAEGDDQYGESLPRLLVLRAWAPQSFRVMAVLLLNRPPLPPAVTRRQERSRSRPIRLRCGSNTNRVE